MFDTDSSQVGGGGTVPNEVPVPEQELGPEYPVDWGSLLWEKDQIMGGADGVE